MVAARETYRNIGLPYNERCLPVKEAMELDNNGLMVVPYVLLARLRRHIGVDKDSVMNVRVADQAVSIHHTGCVPEHESYSSGIVTVSAECPRNPSERCARCILTVVAGQNSSNSTLS